MFWQRTLKTCQAKFAKDYLSLDMSSKHRLSRHRWCTRFPAIVERTAVASREAALVPGETAPNSTTTSRGPTGIFTYINAWFLWLNHVGKYTLHSHGSVMYVSGTTALYPWISGKIKHAQGTSWSDVLLQPQLPGGNQSGGPPPKQMVRDKLGPEAKWPCNTWGFPGVMFFHWIRAAHLAYGCFQK